MRGAGDIVLFSGASAAELRLGEGARREMPGGHFQAERPTLIELVNDVPGAGQVPARRQSAAAGSGSRAGLACGTARL